MQLEMVRNGKGRYIWLPEAKTTQRSGMTQLFWIWCQADPIMSIFLNTETLDLIKFLLDKGFDSSSKEAMLAFWDLEMM